MRCRYVGFAVPMWRTFWELGPGITDQMPLRLRNDEALLVEVEVLWQTVIAAASSPPTLEEIQSFGIRHFLKALARLL